MTFCNFSSVTYAHIRPSLSSPSMSSPTMSTPAISSPSISSPPLSSPSISAFPPTDGCWVTALRSRHRDGNCHSERRPQRRLSLLQRGLFTSCSDWQNNRYYTKTFIWRLHSLISYFRQGGYVFVNCPSVRLFVCRLSTYAKFSSDHGLLFSKEAIKF